MPYYQDPFCYIEVVNGEIVPTSMRTDVMRDKYTDPAELAAFEDFIKVAHMGDYVKIGNTLIFRQNG